MPFELSVSLVITVIIAYFLGNISPSTLLARARGMDIKKVGSGNAGTTNTLRVLGAKAALITLVIDIGKGVLAVLIGRFAAGEGAAMLCAVFVFLGHVWPLLLRFQGGKGVATAFGASVALDWRIGLLALVIVAVTVLISRHVSLGSILGAVSFPFLAYFFKPDFLILACIMAAVVIFKHRSNIGRLVRGEESTISLSWFKKK
jgi:glycerol-3-phosphate acyltransferase PlsY